VEPAELSEIAENRETFRVLLGMQPRDLPRRKVDMKLNEQINEWKCLNFPGGCSTTAKSHLIINRAWYYDVINNRWAQLPDMQKARLEYI